MLPGLFHRLIIELTSVNQTCSIEYSQINSPFYNCLFKNLPPAQWFVLTYQVLTDDHQPPSPDVTLVYTGIDQIIYKQKIIIYVLFLELEELDFRCELNENNQQIDFYWTNLTGFGYTNLTISVLTDENKQLWVISCDPYKSQDICSTKQYRLESGREYHIIAKLKKVLPNYNGQKIGTCSIKTSKN